jgi:hypothetical protein
LAEQQVRLLGRELFAALRLHFAQVGIEPVGARFGVPSCKSALRCLKLGHQATFHLRRQPLALVVPISAWTEATGSMITSTVALAVAGAADAGSATTKIVCSPHVCGRKIARLR